MLAKSFCWQCHGYRVADTRSGTLTLPEKCTTRDQCDRTVVAESEAKAARN